MKERRSYNTPDAEKIMFDYKDQVVATSSLERNACQKVYANLGKTTCDSGWEWLGFYNN